MTTENPIKQELFDESMDDCIEEFDFEEAIQVYYIKKTSLLVCIFVIITGPSNLCRRKKVLWNLQN